MKETLIKTTMREILNTKALDFAKYSVEERAIPSLIDGLKPVQRFFLYSVIQNARTKFNKVAAVSGRVSEFGYAHGETSAADAGALMANTWSNNLPIVEGDGNFGSRMVQEASAARYVYCKLHDNYFKYFKDEEFAPVHSDPEHLPPQFYLPIIPYVLVNGVFGVATGFRTDIPSYCPDSVVACVKEYIQTGKCSEPTFKLPEFRGKIVQSEEENYMLGEYELVGKTKLTIKDIPHKFDREAYVTILDDLVEKDVIVRYEDQCGEDDFQFDVTLKRDFNTDKIIETFHLRQNIIKNIICIDQNRAVKPYDNAADLIKDFVDFRMTFIDTRISKTIERLENQLNFARAKASFINYIIGDEIWIKGSSRKVVIEQIKNYPNLVDFAEELVKMNIYHMTTDEISKLEKDCTKLEKELKYWQKTTAKKEYLKDLAV
ncbi:MAG: DNA gyrase subunit A [Bacilli bacterium]